MKRLRIALAVAAISLVTTTAYAGVNCNQVKKYLATGRTPQDVSETMVITLDEVKKCQEGGDAAAGQPAAQAPGAAPAAPSASQPAPKK
jgi:hypothetical protein